MVFMQVIEEFVWFVINRRKRKEKCLKVHFFILPHQQLQETTHFRPAMSWQNISCGDNVSEI